MCRWLWCLWLVVLVVLLLWLSSGLWLLCWCGCLLWLLLLLWWDKLAVLLEELGVLEEVKNRWLVGDVGVVSGDIWELASELLTGDHLVDGLEVGGQGQIGEGDTVAGDVGVLLEVRVKSLDTSVELSPDLLLEGLVVRPEAVVEVVELNSPCQDFIVSKRDPLLDQGRRLVVGAEEVGVGGDSGDWIKCV